MRLAALLINRLMWTCKHCKKEYELTTISQKANHSRWCSENPNSKDTDGLKKAQQARADENFGAKTKYKVVCAHCSTSFEVIERAKQFPSKSEYFCTRSCANHRGTGLEWENTVNRTMTRYNTICFTHHEKKCVVCAECLIVAAHHLDGDHHNDDPANLIPLCPTHHQYWHSKNRPLVESQVLTYIKNWKEERGL